MDNVAKGKVTVSPYGPKGRVIDGDSIVLYTQLEQAELPYQVNEMLVATASIFLVRLA